MMAEGSNRNLVGYHGARETKKKKKRDALLRSCAMLVESRSKSVDNSAVFCSRSDVPKPSDDEITGVSRKDHKEEEESGLDPSSDPPATVDEQRRIALADFDLDNAGDYGTTTEVELPSEMSDDGKIESQRSEGPVIALDNKKKVSLAPHGHGRIPKSEDLKNKAHEKKRGVVSPEHDGRRRNGTCRGMVTFQEEEDNDNDSDEEPNRAVVRNEPRGKYNASMMVRADTWDPMAEDGA
jgi:hypothetical protein